MVVCSLNPSWQLAEFHELIARLAAVDEGDQVLDLGCGQGNGLAALLARCGAGGKVTAVDRDRTALETARQRHADAVAAGRLSLVDLDIAAALPFAGGGFDVVVCQNVVECVADRSALISELRRLLKLDGTLLVGHHDFDGVLIASDDRDLTRRLVHGYADHVQTWQDVSEGQMGRLLPGLFAASPFSDIATETILFVELALSETGYARRHLDDMVALSANFGIDRATALAWLKDLEARSQCGRFYYALPWTYVVARSS